MKNRFFVHPAAALLCALSALAGASPAAAANCTAAQRVTADHALQLSAADQRSSVTTHLPWGMPTPTAPTTHERILVQRDYVIDYDADVRMPIWTAERVESARLGRVDRLESFRPDPRLSAADTATLADYRGSNYDRGHMAAFADQSTSEIAGNNSFILSNMAPQSCQFNRGIWQILEGIVRLWAAEHGTVYVVSGSVFDRNGDGVRDDDNAAMRMPSGNGGRRVGVPSAFFKIITYRRADGSLATLSIMMPHDTANPDGPAALAYLQAHVTTLAAIEHVTGLDLFPAAGATGLGESATLWPFTGRQPRSLCHQAG